VDKSDKDQIHSNLRRCLKTTVCMIIKRLS